MSAGRLRQLILALVVVVGLTGASSAVSGGSASFALDDDDIGLDTREPASHRPTIEAAFRLESYRPGDTARLAFFSSARGVSVQIVHAGTETSRRSQQDTMLGTPVTAKRWIGVVSKGGQISVALGDWPTGLYLARLTAGGKVGYAPFVLRPRRLGEHRIAVVLSTLTWQAYNFRDDDGDGTRDTWYADRSRHTAHIARPFENRGVPRHYNRYEEPFLRWLIATGRDVDYFSDRDLRFVSADALARGYDLLIFPGHHEYVTKHEYDVVTDFRDRGGNLMFLSANTFFCRVDIAGNVMTRVGMWRDLGRPEAQLVGVQYIGWNEDRYSPAPYILAAPASLAWIFQGTGLQNGDRFCCGGIEIDARSGSSPPGMKVLATIPNVFGAGKTAEMSYYETPAGAKVFAAGAFSMAGAIRVSVMRTIVENLWERLAQP